MKERDPMYHISLALILAGLLTLAVRWLVGGPA